MAVYVDELIWEWRGRRWCHVIADDPAELHEFAARLGLRRRWFQTKPGRPWRDHYDIPSWVRERALELGAIPLTTREMGVRLGRRREEYRALR